MGFFMKNSSVLHFYIAQALTILVLLSALRNLSSIYYLITILLIFIVLLEFIKKPHKEGFHVKIFYFFLVYSIFVIFWSGIYMQSLAFLSGIPRLLLMPIMAIIFVSTLKTEEQVARILKIILFCYIIAALSLIYQIIFGPISWFALPFIRGGLDRYASILGSLTIYGAIAGYPLIILYSKLPLIKNIFLKIAFIIIMFLGAFFSLSKAAIVMLALSVIVFITFDGARFIREVKLRNFVKYSLVIVLAVFILARIPEINSYYNSIVTQTIGHNTIFTEYSGLMDSPPINLDHIIRRLTHWSSYMLRDYGDIVYFIGVGLQGGAGVMGMSPDNGVYPSAHNSLGDLFFMGGFPYLLIFITLYFFTQLTLFINREVVLAKVLFMLNILFFANLLVASGSVFQPAISILFWVSFAYSNILNKNIIK